MGLFGWKKERRPSESECCRKANELISENNRIDAVPWLEKAAAQGNATAMYNLAVFYYNGDGYGQDFEQARRWALRAKKRGYADADKLIENAERQLEHMHKHTAEEWYNAGVYYEDEGENYAPERALYCYEQAARLGHAEGLYAAGIWRLGDSQGCVYELAQAKYWLQKAAKAGHKQAKKALKEIRE